MKDTLQLCRDGIDISNDVNAASAATEVRVWAADGGVRLSVAIVDSGKWLYVGGDYKLHGPAGIPFDSWQDALTAYGFSPLTQ